MSDMFVVLVRTDTPRLILCRVVSRLALQQLSVAKASIVFAMIGNF